MRTSLRSDLLVTSYMLEVSEKCLQQITRVRLDIVKILDELRTFNDNDDDENVSQLMMSQSDELLGH